MNPPVLVPLDGTRESEAALDALGRFSIDASPVILLHVVQPGIGATASAEAPGIDEERSQRRAANDYLDAVRHRMRDLLPDCTTEVAEGDPRVQILVAAKRHGCSMIAMTFPEDGIVGKVLFGSMAGRVAGATAATMLLVPRQTAETDPGAITRVLAPLDGSAASEQAIPVAVQLADRLGAELALLEAVDIEGRFPPSTGQLLPDVSERFRQGLRDQADHYLRQVAEPWLRPGRVITWSIVEGPRPSAIVRACRPGDLVVTVAPPRLGITRWLEGSLVDILSRESPAMVLLTPHDAPGPVAAFG